MPNEKTPEIESKAAPTTILTFAHTVIEQAGGPLAFTLANLSTRQVSYSQLHLIWESYDPCGGKIYRKIKQAIQNENTKLKQAQLSIISPKLYFFFFAFYFEVYKFFKLAKKSSSEFSYEKFQLLTHFFAHYELFANLFPEAIQIQTLERLSRGAREHLANECCTHSETISLEKSLSWFFLMQHGPFQIKKIQSYWYSFYGLGEISCEEYKYLQNNDSELNFADNISIHEIIIQKHLPKASPQQQKLILNLLDRWITQVTSNLLPESSWVYTHNTDVGFDDSCELGWRLHYLLILNRFPFDELDSLFSVLSNAPQGPTLLPKALESISANFLSIAVNNHIQLYKGWQPRWFGIVDYLQTQLEVIIQQYIDENTQRQRQSVSALPTIFQHLNHHQNTDDKKTTAETVQHRPRSFSFP
jgi:hypothetical protein